MRHSQPYGGGVPHAHLFPSRPEIWDELAGLDLENINEAFRRIEMVLGQDSVEGYEELLEGKDDAALLMQAVLDINGPGQLRNVPRHWLYRMREPDQDEEKPTRDDSPAWDLLDQLARAASDELSDLEKRYSRPLPATSAIRACAWCGLFCSLRRTISAMRRPASAKRPA